MSSASIGDEASAGASRSGRQARAAVITDPALEALWKTVLDHWDDAAAHGAFLEHCRENERLDEAAVRYRGMTGDRDRAEQAEKRLRAVALLAVAQLEASRTAPRAALGRTAVQLVTLLLLLCATALLIWAWRAPG